MSDGLGDVMVSEVDAEVAAAPKKAAAEQPEREPSADDMTEVEKLALYAELISWVRRNT